MIDLYEATFDTKWLDFALKLQVRDKVCSVYTMNKPFFLCKGNINHRNDVGWGGGGEIPQKNGLKCLKILYF